jgi:hypothetical protein
MPDRTPENLLHEALDLQAAHLGPASSTPSWGFTPQDVGLPIQDMAPGFSIGSPARQDCAAIDARAISPLPRHRNPRALADAPIDASLSPEKVHQPKLMGRNQACGMDCENNIHLSRADL